MQQVMVLYYKLQTNGNNFINGHSLISVPSLITKCQHVIELCIFKEIRMAAADPKDR